MNWEAIGASGDFLSAVAVVVSLVYLAIQVRQARQMFAASAQQQLTDSFQQLMRDVWSNPEVHRIWHLATTTPGKLSEPDRERFGMLLTSLFTEFSNVLQLSRINPAILENYRPGIDRMLGFPAVRAWWKSQSFTFPQDDLFHCYIDSRIQKLESEDVIPSSSLKK